MSGFLTAKFWCPSKEVGLITIMGHDEEETDEKNWTSRNSASELSNPLENGKKTIQVFESLNFDVRARS